MSTESKPGDGTHGKGIRRGALYGRHLGGRPLEREPAFFVSLARLILRRR